MSAIAELIDLQGRLESQIEGLRSEMDAISRTIKILERESPASKQMVIEAVAHDFNPAPRVVMMEGGLSERCIGLLSQTEWLSPATIRDRLIATKYHMTDRAKLLSSVYATLKRLSGQGRVESERVNGNLAFRRKAADADAA